MNEADALRTLSMDELPETHRKLAEVIGIEATLELCATWGGEKPYIPSTKKLRVQARNNMIRREYCKGTPAPRLAKKYDLTERMVQHIVKDIRPEQISLLD